MLRYKIILNPVSGMGSALKTLPKIEQLLASHQLEYSVTLTEYPWHAAKLAEEAAQQGYDVVVAAGGDGTLNEVLNGLMTSRRNGNPTAALAALPVGRGNDFSFSMGIPLELAAACQTLAENHRRTIDIGRVTSEMFPNGRFFGNGVGVGFDAMVGFVAARQGIRGFLGYLVAAVRTTFIYSPAPVMQIELGDRNLTQPCLMVSVMNGRRMGGGFLMTPTSLPDDSQLDLCIVAEVPKPTVFKIIPLFFKGTQSSHPAVQMAQSQQVRVTALKGALPAHCDGETLCTAGKDLAIELLPRQLELLVPKGGRA
jgi:YegS/Rv2252/BmrU family lipid kinase